MLTPSRVRYRKTQRRRMKGKAYRSCDVLYGSFGLMTLEPRWITANQIESSRVAINRVVKKFGRMWIRIFPDKPYSKKPAETRQGSGKGNPEGYVAVVRPGQILFEVHVQDNPEMAKEALIRAGHKLPVKWRIVEKLELR
ncbi:50S ribosomal protein L16 [bacterium]|nr:50S ribosomal protein L16 [bacterium]